nr:hypothetical protein [uncultured archaeon]
MGGETKKKMNTKILVALVIGIALVGLTGAASAQDDNAVFQYSEQTSMLVGVGNFVGQGQDQLAWIDGGNGNLVMQGCLQDALAVGWNNDILQGTGQYAHLYSDASYAGQFSEQGAYVFGEDNFAGQLAGQVIEMGGFFNAAVQSNDQNIGIVGAGNDVGQVGLQTATVAPFDQGFLNGAFQQGTQGALVIGDDNLVGQIYTQDTVLMGVANLDFQTVNQGVVITP